MPHVSSYHEETVAMHERQFITRREGVELAKAMRAFRSASVG